MADSGQQFVVFYSNSCPHSKDFLVRLNQFDKGLFDRFVKICVDNNPSIPDCIDSVPTIIAPSHSYPLTDNAVFMWLDTVADNYRSKQNDTQFLQQAQQAQQAQPEQQQQPTPGQPQQASPDEKGITPYIPGEMGTSYSDGFSFLDDSMGMSHNFSFLDGAMPGKMPGQGAQSQVPNSGSIDRPMMSKECSPDIDANYEKYMSSRDNDPYIAQAPKRCG
jgi:hypothetical protein